MSVRFGGFALLLAAACSLVADGRAPRPSATTGAAAVAVDGWAPPPVPFEADGAAQLADAERRARAADEATDRARLLGRLHAVEHLRAVRRLHPGDALHGATAAAAAADILRRVGLEREAIDELSVALTLAPLAAESARWRLDAADLERRIGRPSSAAAGYAACVLDERLARADRDRARLWHARTLSTLGRSDEARSLLIALAHDAPDPVHSVRAFDALALAAVQRGAHASAAGWIDACRRRHARAAGERTPTGDRVRRALMRMRALVELRCALFDVGGGDGDPR